MISGSVNQPNANKLTFVMKSDPRKVDSDGDGLEDLYDTQALIFNKLIYNRNNAINYALTWGGDSSSGIEVYNDEYYHKGSDCANFVSQCIYSGGYPMNSEWFMKRFKDETTTNLYDKIRAYLKGIHTEKGWEWSTNWVRAKELYDYMSSENSNNIIEISFDLSKDETYGDIIKKLLLDNNIRKGDLLFFDSGSQVDHATIISNVDYNNYEIYYSGHTSSRTNYPLSVALTNAGYYNRIIIVVMKDIIEE